VTPRAYYFPPVSLQRGFYYHPYFGFYYGPYYGPFYPYPGPSFAPPRYSASAIRTRVKPVETEVYVNGYFAGLVDDFDGVFQRLYVPAGEHEIELYLEGYETFRQRLYLTPGDSRDLVHQMRLLAPGDVSAPTDGVRTVPQEWTEGAVPAEGEPPASPFGILALQVEPADARILVDGEVWLTMNDRPELIVHLEEGPHRLEVEKDGYQTFRTEIALTPGAMTRLNIKLSQ
jgi:hypothetical protein